LHDSRRARRAEAESAGGAAEDGSGRRWTGRWQGHTGKQRCRKRPAASQSEEARIAVKHMCRV
jgi:hypothetical protein